MKLKETARTILRAAKNNSPILLLGTGAIAFGASAYFTWKAGKKHDEVVSEVENDIQEVKETKPDVVVDDNGIEVAESIDARHAYAKTLMKTYGKIFGKLTKLYGPAIALEIIGYFATFKAFGISSRRAKNSLAACIVAEKGFAEYRKRVISALGEDADKEFRLGVKELEVDIPELDKHGVQKVGKDGKPKTKKKKIQYLDGNMPRQASMYARMWSKDTSTEYMVMKVEDEDGFMVDTDKGDNYYNLTFLRGAEAMFNKKLQAFKGNYIWLSEVYKFLGYPETAASRAVGWYFDPDRTDGGDNFIDFGIHVLDNDTAYDVKRKADFINGDTDVILLDFNVNGNIMKMVFPELKEAGA